MSTFKGHAKSLSEFYVFYQRLKSDGYYPKLTKYVTSAADRILKQTQKYVADASAVRSQAQAEFMKEKMLLQQKFGINIDFDYYRNQSDFKEIIDALNACLNLKEVYERNIHLIKNTKGMKGVYSWYPTYFMHAWNDYWPEISAAYEANFMAGYEAADALSDALDQYLPQICISGIERMLDGPEVEHESIDPALKTAYSALVAQIGSINTAGSMAQQIYKAYQLDDLKEKLIEGMIPVTSKLDGNSFKSKVDQMIKKDIHSRGGYSLEAIETTIFQMVASAFGQGGASIHSGSKGIKADNILTLSIDPSIVYDALAQADGSRDSNIAALSELGSKLTDLDDGFIVYSSDKNYTLNNNFSGFGAGKVGVNAQSFLNNVYKANNAVSTLIGTIQQLGSGAILEGQKAAFEQLLAQDVAYMLFDDFTTIGTVSSGANAIHIMNLNGVMFPMSVFLSLLADAIESVKDEEIRRMVSISIDAPAILYPEQEDQRKAFPDNPHMAWEHQRQSALDNTKITAKFLKDFRSIINLLL